MTELRYIDDVVTLELDSETCVGCGICQIVCPHRIFAIEGGKATITDKDLCIECGGCAINCPVNAISVESGVGCASAIIHGWLTGEEPSCDCKGSC
ncbi:MAG: mercury methylation ferredoxin HgcB [Desulfuromonadales bacterium]|nr:mercury methylation ferredoxin HgcB [Desulfuromonadales bacterium]